VLFSRTIKFDPDSPDWRRWMGPLAVDQQVRMAVGMFWFCPPREKKTVDAAEAEIRGILDEVYVDVRRSAGKMDAGAEPPPEVRSPEDMMGPARIRQMIRQAATTCYCMLPPDARTPERVQQELQRIVDRLFRELREDARAFGMGDQSGQHAE